MRRLLLAAAIATAVMTGAPSAQATGGHTVSYTDHLHGQFDDPEGFNPCSESDDTVLWHVNGNLVEHVTYFPAGDEVWFTFTETGTVNFSINGVDWSGHFAIWGNFNQNERNGNATFTANIDLTASDGSIAKGGIVNHVLWDGSQDPDSPQAVFKLAFERDHIINLSCV